MEKDGGNIRNGFGNVYLPSLQHYTLSCLLDQSNCWF